jgi:hypothetical protein
MALSLFNKQSAVPASVCIILQIVYFIWLNFWLERRRSRLDEPIAEEIS